MAGSSSKRSTSIVEKNLELQLLYLELRRKYWTRHGRKLPGLDRVLVSFVKLSFDGRHIWEADRRKDPDQLSYLPIDRELWGCDRELRETLLHEMAHVAVDRLGKKRGEPEHGPTWEREIARLFHAGAYRGLL